jgi:hypothetical protein
MIDPAFFSFIDFGSENVLFFIAAFKFLFTAGSIFVSCCADAMQLAASISGFSCAFDS